MPEISEEELERFAEKMREHTKKRQQMKRALKSVITPIMRRAGFTGTAPLFRRLNPKRHDLFIFDFCRGDDGFSIQVGQRAPDDVSDIKGEKLSPKQMTEYYALAPLDKMTPEHCRLDQRIQPRRGMNPGDFFEYGDANTPEDYRRIALAVVPFVEKTIAAFDDFAKLEKLDKWRSTN
jgi:hypothetical protein